MICKGEGRYLLLFFLSERVLCVVISFYLFLFHCVIILHFVTVVFASTVHEYMLLFLKCKNGGAVLFLQG